MPFPSNTPITVYDYLRDRDTRTGQRLQSLTNHGVQGVQRCGKVTGQRLQSLTNAIEIASPLCKQNVDPAQKAGLPEGEL